MSKYKVGERVVTIHLSTWSLEGVIVEGPHHHNWPEEPNYTIDVPAAGREYVFRESELFSIEEIARLVTDT